MLLEVCLEPLFDYTCGTDYHGDDFYRLAPHSLTLDLQIYVFADLLSGLLLDVIVTRDGYVNHQAFIAGLFSDDYIWLIARMCLSVWIGESHRIVTASLSITLSGLC